jgi:hypothetical protein
MAPRKLKAHRQGCWIEATGSGLLRSRFRWRLPTASGLHGRRQSSGQKSLRIVSITCAGFRMEAGQSTSDRRHILPIRHSQMSGPRLGTSIQVGSHEECHRSSVHQGLETTAIISARTSLLTSRTWHCGTYRWRISRISGRDFKSTVI